MNRGADALVRPATADIARHGLVNISVGWRGIVSQQRGGRHQLSRLAIAALGHLQFQPGLLHGVITVLGKVFDSGNFFIAYTTRREHAGAHGFAVKVDGAGAALGYSATELGAGQADLVPQHPQQRRVRFDVNLILPVINVEFNHVFSEPGLHQEVNSTQYNPEFNIIVSFFTYHAFCQLQSRSIGVQIDTDL